MVTIKQITRVVRLSVVSNIVDLVTVVVVTVGLSDTKEVDDVLIHREGVTVSGKIKGKRVLVGHIL